MEINKQVNVEGVEYVITNRNFILRSNNNKDKNSEERF